MSSDSPTDVLDPVEFLKTVVETRSHSGQEDDVARVLVDGMKRLGFRSQIDDAGNAVGTISRPDANGQIKKRIVLLGHMDTVPGEIPVRIEDGILHGRGSVDAKGPLVTFIMAAATAEFAEGTELTVVGAVEEESATSKGARFAATQYQPDLCIIGEPSGWDGVTLGYKGRILIDFQLSRSMGHTAGQQSGVAESAIEWWNRLSEYITSFNEEREKLFDQLIPAIRSFRTESDGITDRVRLKIGIRLPMDFDCDQFTTEIKSWCLEATIETSGIEAAYQSDRKNALARAFNVAIRGAEAKPRYKMKTGTCDMNVVGPVWQCPIVAYGPGDSKLDHTPEEHLVIDEYLKAIDVLKTVLERV